MGVSTLVATFFTHLWRRLGYWRLNSAPLWLTSLGLLSEWTHTNPLSYRNDCHNDRHFQYVNSEKFPMTCTLKGSCWPPTGLTAWLFGSARSPALAGQKGTSGMTFWSRCKESTLWLCGHISSDSVTTAVRFWARRAESLASSPVQSASRTAEQTLWRRHTCSHTPSGRAIWPRHIMRAINVSVERVIGRWRGELSGRSMHNWER